MIRQKIGFKNAHSLHFKSELEEYLTHYEDADFLEKNASTLASQNVTLVYILTSGLSEGQDEIKSKLASAFEKHGIQLKEYPFRELQEKNFEHFLEVCQEIQFHVKEASCLFLYSEHKSKEADLFAAMFMLTLKSMRSIEPEYAIEYITGNKENNGALRPVFDFKKFLNPDYQIPKKTEASIVNGSDEILTSIETRKSSTDAKQKERAPLGAQNTNTTKTPPSSQTTPSATPSDREKSPANASTKDLPPLASTTEKPVESAPVNGNATPQIDEGEFKRSKFSIKVKLLSIISGILILALGSMGLIASGFFSRATETSIQSNNLNLATTIAGRVEKELTNIGYKAHLMALSLDQGIGTPEQRQLYIDLFLKNNPDVLFLGVGQRAGNAFRFTRTLYNDTAIQSLGLTKEQLSELSKAHFSKFEPALNGAFVVQNVSEGLSNPVLGVGLPLRPGTSVLLFLEPSQFLKSFKTSGLVTAFMVNDKGDVIAHQDSNLVLSATNLANLGIVKTMLSSPSNNGLTQYEDENGMGFLGSYKKLTVGGLGIITTVEKEKAFAEVSRIRLTNFIITVVIVSLSFIFIYFFAKSMSEPIKELAEATQKIDQGDYNINIAPVTRDEIGYLTHSFGHMAVGLAERERAKDALGRFVNKQVAELALSGKIKLGGETKEAAVFFSDLRGFTAMSEGMTPEEVVSYLNEYFTGMVDAVIKTYGIVDKFIGDAVMAHWGAFGSTGNNTENAINGALLMRKAIIAFNERGGGKRPFAKQGCGINTGPVVSGQIGSPERFEFTVIGDTVNLASRIEALNKPFGTDILISQDSYEQVKDIFKVEAMPAIKVKGKTEPQTIYAVIGRLDDPNCPKDLDAVRDMLGIVFDKSKEIDADAKEEKFEVIGDKK